ncbi:helix-turn-helix domain-containing protein [Streptomyces sp. TverLS-915]|uniref:helix-turn-helix domain-containing protein n=1 Tax=Streptomyces sp. TverLS-915 TaxID=1839763 RepID=UPI000B804346|nr:helix-turn-helix transcriptional regulator [Streptomyces sp. TverLS-915]
MLMDTTGIGRRIAYWRERRGLTQADFGRQMGQTRRWVQDLEGGKRQQDPRLSVLVRAAEVLRIRLDDLWSDEPVSTPPPASGSTSVPPPEAAAVIRELYRPTAPAGPLPPLPAMARRVEFCGSAYQACHYGALGRELAGLLPLTQAAAAAASPGAGEAHVLLSRTLQLTASFLHKYGAPTATQAAVVSDRALAAAERSGDPVAIGAAARRVVRSLTRQAHPDAARVFAIGTARRLAPELEQRGPVGLSTLGMLYLNAALSASGGERTPAAVHQAAEHVGEAAEAAARQGADLNADYTSFGPTNVCLHEVDVAVRFEDGWGALQAAERITATAVDRLTRERRARHLATMARAQLLTRQKDAAAASLVTAAQLAPEEITSRATSVALVEDVLGVHAQPPAALRDLARRCGLPA